MTNNQLSYLGLQETRRNNLVVSKETNRHNLATEGESQRHNLVSEDTELRKHKENQRHNLAYEEESHRHNVVSEDQQQKTIDETVRHNTETERIGDAGNQAKITAAQIAAQASRDVANINASTSRANVHSQTKSNEKVARISANAGKKSATIAANASKANKRVDQAIANARNAAEIEKQQMINRVNTQLGQMRNNAEMSKLSSNEKLAYAKFENEIAKVLANNPVDKWISAATNAAKKASSYDLAKDATGKTKKSKKKMKQLNKDWNSSLNADGSLNVDKYMKTKSGKEDIALKRKQNPLWLVYSIIKGGN